MGAVLQLLGGSLSVVLHGSGVAAITVCLVIAVVLPFALFASVGRGYLLPMGMAVLTLIMSNFIMVVGWACLQRISGGKMPTRTVGYRYSHS
jgi:ABC-2 type transport system permease protein